MRKTVNVEDEYKKFPEMERQEVLKLCDWVQKQPHLPNLNEAETIWFFHACLYSMEVSKITIDTHFTLRTHCPEMFGNFDPYGADIKRAMKTVAIMPLPQLTPEGYRVVLSKLSDFDASNFNFLHSTKLYVMAYDICLHQEGIPAGEVVVIDMKGCTLGHVARLGLMTMKKFLFFLQDAAAIRIVGFHFINIVPFMDKILAIMGPFMKKELSSLIQLHSNMETFYKYVPQKILPGEYGGSEKDTSVLKEIINENVRDNSQLLKTKEDLWKVNEKLRPGKPKNATDLFGAEGNFKKLEID